MELYSLHGAERLYLLHFPVGYPEPVTGPDTEQASLALLSPLLDEPVESRDALLDVCLEMLAHSCQSKAWVCYWV